MLSRGAALGLLLVPLAASAPMAAETCLPVPYDNPSASPPALSLSADGGWLAAAGQTGVQLFSDPVKVPVYSFDDGAEAVSIHRDLMAVGGGGSVRVYQKQGSAWSSTATVLNAPRPGVRFGASVALGDQWLVVGAPEDGALHEGAAYLYSYSAAGFAQPSVLRPADGRLNDRFGTSVAVDGNTIAVGSPYADDLKVFFNFGAAYVFDAKTGGQTAKLQAADSYRPKDIQFGASVAIRGSSIVVGAPGADAPGNNAAGSAYLFTLKPEGWTKTAELTPGDPTPGRQLGASVAIDEDGALVGAPGNGSAYLFNLADGSKIDECGCGGRYGRSVALWTRGGQREAFLGDADGVKGCFKIPEQPEPVLTCEFEHPPVSLPAGAAATYTVKVRNEGAAEAKQARLVVKTNPKVGAGACKAGCSASIPADGEKSFRVTFALPPACEAPESIQPRASVWFKAKETACTLPPPTRIERPLGVQARIEGDGLSVLSGKELTYHLRLENNGPGPAPDSAGPELEHALPPGLVLVDWKVVAGGGTFEGASKPSGDPTESLQWDGAIPLCGTVDLQVTARVPYDQGQEEETVCLEATVRDRDGRPHPATPYCFRIVPYPEITPSGGR
jgi:hypothetical protein